MSPCPAGGRWSFRLLHWCHHGGLNVVMGEDAVGYEMRGQGVRTEREHVQCDVCIGAAHRMRLKKVIVFFIPLEAHVLLENSARATALLKILE